eukprot:jgi/Chrzof1/14269/Cz08g31210.t1
MGPCPLLFNNTIPLLSYFKTDLIANANTTGLLTSNDWQAFKKPKQDPLVAGRGINLSNSNISCVLTVGENNLGLLLSNTFVLTANCPLVSNSTTGLLSNSQYANLVANSSRSYYAGNNI